MVCKLKKAIYSLKKSPRASLIKKKKIPRAWFDKLSQVEFVVKFQRSQSDHSVFVCHASFGL